MIALTQTAISLRPIDQETGAFCAANPSREAALVRRVLNSGFVLGAATALGRALRLARLAAERGGLSVLGAGVVALGLAMAWPPLGVIALGLAVLAADWGRSV